MKAEMPPHEHTSIGRAIRVGVDGRSVSGRRTGVGRYVGELLSAAARLAGSSVQFTTVLFRSPNGCDVQDLRAAGVKTRKLWRPLEKAFYVGTRLLLPVPFELVAPGQDVMLFPNYRRFVTLGKPTVSVIYDLGYLVAPESVHPRFIHQLRWIAPQAIRRSDVVIAVSHTVAAEIAAAYPSSAARLRVIRPGPARELSTDAPADWRARLERLGLRPGYLLHVGTIEPRKNLVNLMEAMRRLPPGLAKMHPLLLVGPRGWSDGPILKAIDSAADRVRHLSFLPDPDLRAVYEGASLLVFPSQYEGFGLPILEAMCAGLPVACSDIPVLREVGGRAPAYFDHRDPAAIAATLVDLLTNPDHREAMAARGRTQANRFSWEPSASLFLDTLVELSARNR
ncbi:MAG: glycosyltransferase family 4 protein [Actinomycetota bacterium]|nr:glycosyltransferase family 4 protein [Actinomycetota bacterium]